jgi:hypothetical protein
VVQIGPKEIELGWFEQHPGSGDLALKTALRVVVFVIQEHHGTLGWNGKGRHDVTHGTQYTSTTQVHKIGRFMSETISISCHPPP